MGNPGIYILTNNVNGKQYVGMDSEMPNRANQHLRGDTKKCRVIHAAIKKYGCENFDVEFIRYPGISRKALYAVEQWKISQLNTKSPNGYNLTDGGEGPSGFKHTDESRRKMSEAHMGKKLSADTRKKMSEARKVKPPWNKGKTGVYTDEQIKKMKDAHKGQVAWNKGIKTGRRYSKYQLDLFDK